MRTERWRIFAPGAFHAGNKGDAALVLAFRDWLDAAFANPELTITSFSPQSDQSFYNIPAIDMIVRPHHFLHRAAGRAASISSPTREALVWVRVAYVSAIIGYLKAWARLRLKRPSLARALVPAHVNRVADSILDANVVITVPGGYQIAARRTDDLWLFHLPTFALTKALGRPLIIGPCSFGPFVGVHRRFARKVLGLADLMLLRERRSIAIAESLGGDPHRIRETPDLAFAFAPRVDAASTLPDLERLQDDLRAGKRVLGISVRNHNFPGDPDPVAREQEYLETVRDAVRRLAEHEPELSVYVVPQTTDDADVSRRLVSLLQLPLPVRTHLVSAELDPYELQRLYAHFRLMLGTRMHANILALGAGTPVVGIAYEPKTLGILEQLGLSDWGLAIEAISNDRLSAMVIAAWDEADKNRAVAGERADAARTELARVAGELAALAATISPAKMHGRGTHV